jgi:hypothetical protein
MTSQNFRFVPTCTGPKWLFQEAMIHTYGDMYYMVHTALGMYLRIHNYNIIDGDNYYGIYITAKVKENREGRWT